MLGPLWVTVFSWVKVFFDTSHPSLFCLYFVAARNIFVVVGASIVAFAVTDLSKEERPITLTNEIKAGLPPLAIPSFSISYTIDNVNSTGNVTVATADFAELLSHLGSGLIVIPLVGFLESIAIAKSFGELVYTNANLLNSPNRPRAL